jgi:hypothetical protein
MSAVYEDEKARRRVSTLLDLVTALFPKLLAKSQKPSWIAAGVFIQEKLLSRRYTGFSYLFVDS